MRRHLFYLAPIATGLAPGVACLGAIWMYGQTALGLAGAFVISAVVGAAAFVEFADQGLVRAARALSEAAEGGVAREDPDRLGATARAPSLQQIF